MFRGYPGTQELLESLGVLCTNKFGDLLITTQFNMNASREKEYIISYDNLYRSTAKKVNSGLLDLREIDLELLPIVDVR